MRRLFWPLETILIKSGIFLEKMVHKENQHLSMDDLEQALELTDKNEIKDERASCKASSALAMRRRRKL